MRTEWRAISGPVLITAVSLAALAADQAYSGVPNPAPLQVCIVAVAAALAGIGSGLVSAVIAVATNAVFIRHHGSAAEFNAPELLRLGLLAVTTAATAGVTSLLRQKMRDAMAWERDRHATTTRLAAALDQIDIGVVLLDADTRAEFINLA
ncbi:MAG: DUF4118 domain-containing protein, partial [Rhizobiales bacterium]|nr:DUF4118 domain-containing protein [Hyphomicrobiales bacterium]